jgi:predicted DNA-binding transcriptional regulator AlpA
VRILCKVLKTNTKTERTKIRHTLTGSHGLSRSATTTEEGSMDLISTDPLVLNRVVPRLRAIEIAGVSEATWERMERKGEGPKRVLVSERRVGYRVNDLLAWLDARAAKTAA